MKEFRYNSTIAPGPCWIQFGRLGLHEPFEKIPLAGVRRIFSPSIFVLHHGEGDNLVPFCRLVAVALLAASFRKPSTARQLHPPTPP